MPWASNAALPEGVRNALPEAAQTIFRKAADGVFENGGTDQEATAAGWSACKSAGYYKTADGDWKLCGDSEAEQIAALISWLVDDDDIEVVTRYGDAQQTLEVLARRGIKLTKEGRLMRETMMIDGKPYERLADDVANELSGAAAAGCGAKGRDGKTWVPKGTAESVEKETRALRRRKLAKRYASVSELPESVRKALPVPAQAVYLARYNEVYAEYGDDNVAGILAWEAVKLGWVKKGATWEKRQTALSRLVLETTSDRESRLIYMLSEVDVMSPEVGAENRMRTWVDACVEGTWEYEGDKLTITPKMMAEFIANFRAQVLGTEPPVDYQHLSMDPFAAADDTRAAGWIKDLKIESRSTAVSVGEGGAVKYENRAHLLALVEWTEEAWAAVSDRRFRYISPAFDTNHKDRRNGDRVGACLLGIAVTNTPFLTGLAPIVASRRSMSVTKATDGKPVQGGPVEELLGLVKAQALTFDALVSKWTAAGVAAAREAAAFVLLIVSDKIPAEAANAPVAVADLEAVGAKSWADELTAAGTPTLTITAPAEAEIAKAVTALKAAPKEGEESNPPPQAPPAGSEANKPVSKTVKKEETVVVEFTREGKSETMKLGRADVLMAEREELLKLRKERLDSQIVTLARPNEDGYGLPPVVVTMTRAVLDRKEGEPIKLTNDATEPDVSAAFLHVLSEVRDRGLVKLSEQAATQSQPGAKGSKVEGLEYGPDSVPAEVRARYVAQHGDTVTDEDICIAELMLALRTADSKLTVDEAKLQAEKAVALAVKSEQEV